MPNITIGNTEMPKTKKITYGRTELSKTVTTADGTEYRELVGEKSVITCEWDYVPAAIINEIFAITGYVMVAHPDIDGNWTTTEMKISKPKVSLFRFVNGIPVWHGVKLTLTGRRVL